MLALSFGGIPHPRLRSASRRRPDSFAQRPHASVPSSGEVLDVDAVYPFATLSKIGDRLRCPKPGHPRSGSSAWTVVPVLRFSSRRVEPWLHGTTVPGNAHDHEFQRLAPGVLERMRVPQLNQDHVTRLDRGGLGLAPVVSKNSICFRSCGLPSPLQSFLLVSWPNAPDP
jgi:hypothetical protein